jgi:hypothetical protein
VTRLVHQKGIHLIKHAAWRTCERGAQFVLLGSAPDPKIQVRLDALGSCEQRVGGVGTFCPAGQCTVRQDTGGHVLGRGAGTGAVVVVVVVVVVVGGVVLAQGGGVLLQRCR